MSVDHYENFPVASLLCPPRLRPAVTAIYWFARTADDLADEGDAAPEQRLAELALYRGALELVAEGRIPQGRWESVFAPLAQAVAVHALPIQLLRDLLSAFEQDVTKHDYADRAELLDYCRRSANPIGRLLLHLYRVHDERALAQSDAICTALQLANFWQDVSVDIRRGRLYAPACDRARHGVCAQALLNGGDGAAIRSLFGELVDWTRELMHDGADLVHAIAGRAGWELRLVVQGGLRVLEKIERNRYAVTLTRPTLGAFDAPLLLHRALFMRPRSHSFSNETP